MVGILWLLLSNWFDRCSWSIEANNARLQFFQFPSAPLTFPLSDLVSNRASDMSPIPTSCQNRDSDMSPFSTSCQNRDSDMSPFRPRVKTATLTCPLLRPRVKTATMTCPLFRPRVKTALMHSEETGWRVSNDSIENTALLHVNRIIIETNEGHLRSSFVIRWPTQKNMPTSPTVIKLTAMQMSKSLPQASSRLTNQQVKL
jgi:hypothetical protein